MARPDICDMRTSRERNRQQLGISDGAAMRETCMTRITQRTCATEYTRGLVSGAHADQQENLEIQKNTYILICHVPLRKGRVLNDNSALSWRQHV